MKKLLIFFLIGLFSFLAIAKTSAQACTNGTQRCLDNKTEQTCTNGVWGSNFTCYTNYYCLQINTTQVSCVGQCASPTYSCQSSCDPTTQQKGNYYCSTGVCCLNSAPAGYDCVNSSCVVHSGGGTATYQYLAQCSKNCSTSGGSTNNYSWGSWGNTPAGASISNFSNLLGAGAPANASKASWENVLSTFLSLLFLAAIVVSLAFFILGGYNWMFSGGDKQKVEKARQNVLFAIIGLVIVFVSILIISVLGKFFGIDFTILP